MAELHAPAASKIEYLRRAPWQIMLLVKWVCQDPQASETAPDIDRRTYNEIRQEIWTIPERLDPSRIEHEHTHLFIRQILNPQAAFQRRLTAGFAREASILLQLQRDHPLRLMFKESTGFRLTDYIDLTLATHCALRSGKKHFRREWFDPLEKTYSKGTIDNFVSSFSRSIEELKTFFRSLPASNRKYASEINQFPPLKRYPFLRTGNTLECWDEYVFYRGTEDYVHTILSEHGQRYMDLFSKIFERHVVSEATKIDAEFYDEKTIASWLPRESKVTDGLLSFRNANVLIESKAGMFDHSVMSVSHAETFSNMTGALRDAIQQGWFVSRGIRTGKSTPDNVRNALTDYLLIVTNRELSAGRATLLERMYPPGTLTPPDALSATKLPLNNIYVLSVEDFERFSSCAQNRYLDIPAFLEECVTLDSDPSTSCYYFEQHLDRTNAPILVSKVVSEALDQSAHRLEKALGGHVRFD